MASTAAASDPEHKTKDREEEENAPAADDEDTGAQVAPIVKLEEVAITTGEEDEDPILDLYELSFAYLFFKGFASFFFRSKKKTVSCFLFYYF